MGKGRRRGRETMVICHSCGRRMPRDKSVSYVRTRVYSTDLKTDDDVRFMERDKEYYCISCGKHRRIFEKKKRMMMRKYNQ